jgi:hypothetical protein
MRNIFDQYNQPENKLTHSLVSCLYEDKYLLNSFLENFCLNFFNKSLNLKIEQQTVPGELNLIDDENQKKGLPDAVIYSEEQCLIIESKVSSTLTEDQLVRHEKTVRRRGFNNIRGIGIVVDLLPKVRLDNWKQITWNKVYSWAHKEAKKSEWATKLVDYFNVLENNMVENEYLKEGSITEFTGISFNNENLYSYGEGKRQLKLLLNKVKKNNILEKELNADLNSKGRGGIKKGNVWDFITFKSSDKIHSFTGAPHLTLGITPEYVGCDLTIPYKIQGKAKKNFYDLTWEKFKKIFYEIGCNYKDNFGNSEGFKPRIVLAQRRYPSQSSPAIHDAILEFDIRTAFKDLSSGLRPTQKQQQEWLKIVFDINNNKKSNIQFQIGAAFYFNKKENLISDKDADQVMVKSYLSCKPLIKEIFK